MIEGFGAYLVFMGDLMIGVTMWIAPGALGVMAFKMWRKFR